MKVQRAREIIRRQNALRRDERPVRAAAHRDGLGCDVEPVHRLVQVVDGAAVRVRHRVRDIPVGVLHRVGHARARLTLLQLFDIFEDEPLAPLVACLVVVADVELDDRRARIGADGLTPDIALRALGAFGRLPAVKEIDEIDGKQGRVDEHALRTHRMCAHALNRDGCTAGVERLIDDLTEGAAVDRIGVGDGELCKVHVLRSPKSAFLVGDKGDIEIAVRDGGITRKCRERGHDVRDCRLVVRAEDARAVGHDDLLPNVRRELRVLRCAHDDVFSLVQHDVAALIVQAARLHDGAERDVHRVHMRAESDGGGGRRSRGQICRQTRREDAVLAQGDILCAELREFLLEQMRHIPLALGARHLRSAVGLALRRHLDVAEKAFDEFFFCFMVGHRNLLSICVKT